LRLLFFEAIELLRRIESYQLQVLAFQLIWDHR
jgi:hypothetical protein